MRAGIRAVCLALAGGLAWAQGVLVPRVSTLLPGQTRSFRLQVPGASGPAGEGWVWSILEGGVGDLAAGSYRAPSVTEPTLVKIQAVLPGDSGRPAQAQILVLPHAPFALVALVLGPDWLVPFAGDLPFQDAAAGSRFDSRARVFELTQGWAAPLPLVRAGYGIPARMAWASLPGAVAELLTYRDGDERVQRDVTGLGELTLTLRGPAVPYTLEGLRPVPGRADTWESQIQHGRFQVRGLALLAGDGEEGHRDGRGAAARFRAPFGVATVWEHNPEGRLEKCHLVSDPGSHVIRHVTQDGQVSTPWGVPGQEGHEDLQDWEGAGFPRVMARILALGGPARFNGPTFLEVGGHRRLTAPPWRRCHVSDSGNHVIRTLRPWGFVETLAGVPGLRGYRDCPLGAVALFDTPMGLAEDGRGNLYVADAGNRVIRRISREGEVGTLAGVRGQAGDRDGPADQARFTDLRGLAVGDAGPGEECLYAADGHAIRRIQLPGGEVETVLGVVATAGDREIADGPREARVQALREPCLDRPCGLVATWEGLLIADQGNHCLRAWDEAEATLTIRVGDPGQGATREGLLRDGVPGPLEQAFATLEAPKTMAACASSPRTYALVTGRGLAQVAPDLDLREPLALLECRPVMAGLACTVHLRVGPAQERHDARAEPLRVQYTLTFLEPDGTLADRFAGTLELGEGQAVAGNFSQRGRGSILFRGVSSEGVALGSRVPVESTD